MFQCITSSGTSNNPPPTDHYNITVTHNTIYPIDVYGTSFYNIMPLYYLTVHCKWITTAAYYGHHPGPINKVIIDSPDFGRPLNTHSRVCLCSSKGESNCSLDAMGPVYPGQVLQARMAMQNKHEVSFVYTETHADSLPKSACRVPSQTDHELIHTLTGIKCKSLNFKIVSNSSKECELFLTAQPDTHYFYDAFYVQLMECPVAFVLLDGVCDCDPILSSSDLHIKSCDIDQATIMCPVNSWIKKLQLV